MASFSSPPPQNLAFSASAVRLTPAKRQFYPHPPPPRSPDPALCRCAAGGGNSSSSSSDNPLSFHRRLNSTIQDVLENAIKRFDSVMNSFRKQDKDDLNGGVSVKQCSEEKNKEVAKEEEWDWDCWNKHFEQVDDQERLLSVLKSQLSRAVDREDYEDAARLKVAIAAAATNDTVGQVMSHLNRAVVEERYQDAAILRDKAGAGLVGWWSGIPEDAKDPYGIIIRITAEHGRYVARSYSPRQLTTSAVGAPLFEIFLTATKKGEYKKQAVYLRWREFAPDSSSMSSKTLSSSSPLTPSGKNDLFLESTEDEEDGNDTDDDSDLLEESSGFQNILRDMLPGLKVKVLKVTFPGKVDKNFISKVIEQMMDEEDEDKDIEEDLEVEDDEIKGEIDQGKDESEMDTGVHGVVDNEQGSEIAVKVVIGDIAHKLSGSLPVKEPHRFPAKLETKGHSSFSFCLEKETNREDSSSMGLASADRKLELQGKRSINNLMFDLAKSIEKEKKISLKLLKDVSELLNLTLSQARNRQQLSGLTTFSRIDVRPSPDPLDGLYIGAHGLYTSEVIHLKRKFGQWKDDDGTKKSSDIEFYEYVEAVKLTGDPYVPAGKVAFRAKIGKQYQLPHKGIIPEEFGVIARYKGQGRLAEPGFRTPRWVDGELVILDGKYIKGGPVVGFVYWAPEYHFVVFFNRLRLQP